MLGSSEQKKQEKKEFMYRYPAVDITYGMLIIHAKEGLKTIQEQPIEITPFVFDKYIPWLELEIKRLKRERKEEIYKDLVDNKKLSNIVSEMERLLVEFRVEKERLQVQNIELSPSAKTFDQAK